MRHLPIDAARWLACRWMRYSNPHPEASDEPESQIAFALFSSLTVVALVTAVAGWPLWGRKEAATAFLLSLAAGSAWGRAQSLRGQHVRAMHVYAALTALVTFTVTAFGERTASPALILMMVLPAYGAVCGVRYAVGLGSAFLVFASLVIFAPSVGVHLPKFFPVTPTSTLAVAAMSMAATLWPLVLIYRRLVARTRALNEHEQRLRLAMSVARQGWFELNLGTGQIAVSPEFEAILGWSAGEYPKVMAQWLDDVHPEDRAQADAGVQAWLRDGASSSFVFRRRARHGDWVWLETMGRAVERDDQGQPRRVVGVQMDVTERRRAEIELDSHRLNLEVLVRERTAALEQSQAELRHAKEVAEAGSVAKSTFLANMSHELRTPLNAIIGMVGLLRRRSQDMQLREQLAKVDRASKHLLELISNILDLSKIEADRMELEALEFQVGPWLDRLMAMVELQARDKGLNFVVEVPDDIATMTLHGDALRLGQILLNFTSNAVKFTSRGHIVVRVCMESQSPQAVQLRFEVEDTGIGVDEDAQPRLFAAFEQADGSMTRRYGGTGLGLAISKRLATLMGGTVGMRSEHGQGSTFWFTVELPHGETTPSVGAAFSGQAALQRLREVHPGALVLLVEDDPINQEVGRELLIQSGLQVDLAADGEQAVAMSRQRRYALILMDVQLPRCNGLDATRAIRAESLNRGTPIVAMTANAFEQDRCACLEAGMNDHLAKPVDPDRFHETLLRWLDQGQTNAAAIPPPSPG